MVSIGAKATDATSAHTLNTTIVNNINTNVAMDNDSVKAGNACGTIKTTVADCNAGVAVTGSGRPKEKRRNNEKRKEKSRDAARCRRSRETEIFTELADELPLKREDVNQLDKASVMRIAIAYLRVREMLQLFPKIQEVTGGALKIDTDVSDDESNASAADGNADHKFSCDLLQCVEVGELIKQTLDGFLIILSNDGDITYASDNINDYLGLAKIDILGQQIWEYSHQCDHAELKEALNIKRNGLAAKVKNEQLLEQGLSAVHRDLFARLKCTLTSRGRNINIKSASYKVIHLTGHLVMNGKGDRVLIAIGRPIPHPSNIEIPLGTTTFLTKHSLDMKYTYVDDKMFNLFGYKPDDLLEKSMYSCYHGGDTDSLLATFKSVVAKGQGETCRYRYLGKYGGYCWIVTQATVVYDKQKPQSVVCVNYVISNLENKNEIYSLAQYDASQNQQQQEQEQQPKLEESVINKTNNCNHKIKSVKPVDDKPHTIEIKENTEESSINLTPPTTPPAVDQPTTITPNPSTTISNKNCIKNNNKTETLQKSTTSLQPPQLASLPASPLSASTATTTSSSITAILPQIKCEQSATIVDNISIVAKKSIDNKSIVCDHHTQALRNLQSHYLLSSSSSSKPPPIEENRPKSVTASVFRAAPSPLIADRSSVTGSAINDLPISGGPLSASPLPAIIVDARVQSVNTLLKPVQRVIKSTNTARPAILDQPQAMNKGYLSFTEDATELTMLKEEPDDLVHLAPTAVDACMPLDETTPFFGEMFVGLGSYGSLLPDDINSLGSPASTTSESHGAGCASAAALQSCSSSQSNYSNSSNSTNSQASGTLATTTTSANGNGSSNHKGGQHIDPFINYREESNDTSSSQHLLSPSVTSKSPEASSLPSLCSPNSLSQEDEFVFMTMNDDIDLTMRAPYIPMNEQEDLPLLNVDEVNLMWCGSNAFTAEDLNIYKDVDAIQQLQLQQQQQQQQQQQTCDNGRNMLINYQQQQQQQQHQQQQQQQHQQQLHQQQFSSSLCSSPASTVSSLSPSPVNHLQQQHQHQHQQLETQQHQSAGNGNSVFGGDSSELAALLCGSGSGTLSILSNSCGDTDDNDDGGCIVEGIVGGGAQQQQSHCGGADFRLQLLQQHLQEQEREQQRQQQQEQQQQLLGLTIDCKKEKFDSATLASTFSDSIEDAFDNVYSKDSSNIDTWNELLQLNVNDTSSSCSPTASPIAQQQLEDLRQQDACKAQLVLQQMSPLPSPQEQQNIILNAVPLISIQSNKNIMLQQQDLLQHQQQQQRNTSRVIINENMPAGGIRNGNSNGNGKMATIKLLQATPVTATATIRVVESKQRAPAAAKTLTPQQQQLQQQQQQHGNKRHLSVATTATTQVETKRLKSTNGASAGVLELQANPQLLQQLIATTTPTIANAKVVQQLVMPKQQPHARKSAAAQRWTTGSSVDFVKAATAAAAMQQQHHQQQQQQQQQQSNSVLKNLLVNGCDDIPSMEPVPMLIDDNSLDQAPLSPPLCISPTSPNRPLHCFTSTASVLRNYRHNPMIGGPNALPSPPFGTGSGDDSSPPGLTACDSDSASDSGIDDICLSARTSPLKSPHGDAVGGNAMLLMKCMDVGLAEINVPPLTQDSESNGKRRFMDSSDNPLMTPFLMELGNDDYNMSADIEHVLSEWSHEMV